VFRLFKPALSNLLTAIVNPTPDGFWQVTWVPDMVKGRLAGSPRNFSERSLNRAVEKASSEVAALYAGRPEAITAELQFAIYPWSEEDERGHPIIDVSWTIEGLVEECARQLPVPGEAMLRWIRKIAEIPAS